MDINLEDQKVLLIGATDVLGYTCAEVLAAEGCDLALVDSDMNSLKAVTSQLRDRYDVSITSHAGDLSDPEWQASVLEVAEPVDLILFDWASFVLPVPKKKGSKKATEITAITLEDAHRIASILGFCRSAISSIRDRNGSGVFVSLIGSLSYAAEHRVNSLDDMELDFWPMLESSATIFTETIGKENVGYVRGIAVKVEGHRSDSGDATEFEVQVADTVSFLFSDRATAITGSTILLRQN